MINVAIDGPAGAGKSTLSRRVAEALGYIYVDTGALYRTVGLALSRAKWNGEDISAVEAVLAQSQVELTFVQGEQRVLLCGEDVSDLIRTPEASMMASKCSALPVVRAYLLDLQRDIAKKNNIVMDGRDIGTVVLPDAKVKIFLTATPEERARRRFAELQEKGQQVTYDSVLADQIARDHADMTREIAPLKQAADAVLVDTTDCDFEQSFERLLSVIRQNIEKE